LTPDIAGYYGITLAVNDGVQTASIPFVVTAVAYTPPMILSDLVEPVSGVVMLSLSSAQDPTATIGWLADGVAIGTGTTVSWDTTSLANGSHVVTALVQTDSNYSVVTVTRTFQTKQTTVSFITPTIAESAGALTAIAGAQSVNGIVSVAATLDGVAIGSLAVPNGCLDYTGVACASSGPNGYSFSQTVGSGAHVVVITATDGIGNSLGTQLRLTVTDVP